MILRFIFICLLFVRLYPINLENRIFGCAPGFDNRKWIHVSNVDPLPIVKSLEFSLQPKTGFPGSLGICCADFCSHLKGVGGKTEKSSVEKIDFIYIINLDQRPEKLTKSLDQLKAYGITPQRFSAINGWNLSQETFDAVGVKFMPGMQGGRWAAHFASEKEYEFLMESSQGKTFYFRWMTPGMIGCALSHLSVLQDAYDAGYQTIWVLEDDIAVQKDHIY